MKRVMIVDAFNQFIRGYIVDPSKNPNGQPIGGMRTFINIMNKITREIDPDMIVVVWDGKGGSKKRRAMNKNYKAGRKPLRVNWNSDEMTAQDTDNNKLWQQLRVIEYLNQTPMVQFMEPEVEADEVSVNASTAVFDLITGTPPIATTVPLPKSPLFAEKSLETSLSTFANL